MQFALSGTFTLPSNTALSSGYVTFDTQGFNVTIAGGALTDTASGRSSLVKAGTGSLTLGVAETYTGYTEIEGGTLVGGVVNAFSASEEIEPQSGASFDLGGHDQAVQALGGYGPVTDSGTAGNTLTIEVDNGTGYFQGDIQDGVAGGTISLVKVGTGTQYLLGASTYSGGTAIDAGTLDAGNSTALGTGIVTLAGTPANGAGATDPVGQASLDIYRNNLNLANAVVLGTADGANGGIVDTTSSSATGYTLTLSGDVTGAGTLEKAGSGTLILSGVNTYTGATEVTGGKAAGSTDGEPSQPSASTLQGGVANAFGTNSAVSVGAYSTLDLGGYDQAIGSLSNFYDGTAGTVTDTGAAATLAVGGGDETGSFKGTIQNGTGVLALVKVGTGTETLSGTDSYTGGTALDGGTLELASQSAAGKLNNTSTTPGTVTFSGAPAVLQLDSGAFPAGVYNGHGADYTYSGGIAAFAAGDAIDLRSLAYSDAATATYDGTSLTVGVPQDGPTDGDRDILSNFTATSDITSASFMLASDGNGGTLVYVPGAAPTFTAPTNGADTDSRVVTGTGVAGDVLSLTIVGPGGTMNATTPVNKTGDWTYALPSSDADGSYTVTAIQTASGNGPSNSAADSFTLDTTPPTITALAESGAGIDGNGNGDLNAGKTVTLTVTTSEPVYVSGGTPTLTLNDGGTATYTGGSSTNQQTFSYTVQPGQNVTSLAVTAVNANGATVTDAAGNPLSTSLMGVTVPSGTLTIDTTPPAASSVTDTAAQNAGPTPIGLAAPSDNLTPAGSLAITVSGLPSDGTVMLADGTTRVTAGESLTAAQLTGLEFTPTPGGHDEGSTFTYTVTDGAGNASTGTAALNVGSPGAPTITGTHATATMSEAAVSPFTGVTVADPSATTETLTIALTGSGGMLAGAGLMPNANGTYALTGSAGAVTAQLDALRFTPTAGAAGTTSTTTFVLTDASSAGTSVTDAGTSVADTDSAVALAPAPTPTPIPVAPGSGGAVGVTPADAVTFTPLVTYDDGVFTLSGTATSAVGVSNVELFATLDDGSRADLGAAAVNTDGTFTFADDVGFASGTQGFITAVETDGAGVNTSALASYALTAGLDTPDGSRAPFVAEQDVYNADGSATTSVSLFRNDGNEPPNAPHDSSRQTTIMAPGQTFVSDQFDDYKNGGQPDTTFVFNPNHGLDTISLFRVDNADHDILSFKGSDFGNSIANVLANTTQTSGGSSIIVDPTTHDAVKLTGITKAQLTENQGDFMFHA